MDDTLLWFLLAVLLAVLLASWGLRHVRRDAPDDDEEEADALETAHELDRVEAERLADEEAERREAERLAAEERARVQARQVAQEAARRAAEQEAANELLRIAARREAEEQAAREAQEAQRIAAERRAALAEAARVAAERAAAAKRAAEEAARVAAERRAAQEAARLQAEREAAAAQAAAAPPAPALPTRTPAQTVVMIADDSKVVRVKTSRLLAQYQYQVALAADGLEAARAIESGMPHVLITDVDMPGMDGFALTRHVRENPRTAHIPVIMITAADDKHRDDAARAGVSVLLGKPYPEEELIAHIEATLSKVDPKAHGLAACG
ncbi:MAG TPA: response regulator [Albitalea sp.]|nr:response regulator [Albitalea sp.]